MTGVPAQNRLSFGAGLKCELRMGGLWGTHQIQPGNHPTARSTLGEGNKIVTSLLAPSPSCFLSGLQAGSRWLLNVSGRTSLGSRVPVEAHQDHHTHNNMLTFCAVISWGVPHHVAVSIFSISASFPRRGIHNANHDNHHQHQLED